MFAQRVTNVDMFALGVDRNGNLRAVQLASFKATKPKEHSMIIDTNKIKAKLSAKAAELHAYADHKITQAKPEVASFLRKVAQHLDPKEV